MVGWRIALWAALVIGALVFLFLVRAILLPFLVVFIIASVLEPLIRKLRYRGFSRGVAVLSILAPFYLVLAGVIAFVGPRIANDISGLSSGINSIASTLSESTDNTNFFIKWNPVVEAQQSTGIDASIDKFLKSVRGPLEKVGLPSTRQEIMQEYVEPNKTQINHAIKNGALSFFGILGSVAQKGFSLLIVVVGVPMLLIDLENFKQQYPRWIPPTIRANTMALLSDIGQVFTKYLRGIATVLVLYIVSASVILSLLGVPYSLLLGILFGALYLVPILGNLTAYSTLLLVVGLTGTTGNLLFHVHSPWIYAIIVTGIYMVMGLSFDQMLYPTLVGSAVGLSGIVSLFVIVSGAALFGIVGMIVAFPLAGSVKIIIDRVLRFSTSSQESLALPQIPLRHRQSNA